MKVSERIFIDDGNLIFTVVAKRHNKVTIKAANKGVLLPGKGINLPDSYIDIPTITSKDKSDIQTAIEAHALPCRSFGRDRTSSRLEGSSRGAMAIRKSLRSWKNEKLFMHWMKSFV